MGFNLRSKLASATIALALATGCGNSGSSHPPHQQQRDRIGNVGLAVKRRPLTAKQLAALRRFYRLLALRAYFDAIWRHAQETISQPPWPCIATAETGGTPATGPTYWTVYGMVTDIIREYGSPAQQQAVFSGTASLYDQTDIASRFAADHGFGGWGVLTRQKCGLG